MKADAITKKILDDARQQAAQTLKEAHERAEALKGAAEQRLEQKRQALDAQTKEDCEVLRSRMLRMAELEAKKQLLGAKREVIEQVFDTALAGLRNMPKDQQAAYNKKLLLGAAQGGEAIACDAEDAALFNDAFLKEVNAELQKQGKQPVALSKARRATGGGFILVSSGMEINCTYAAVLQQVKPQLEAEVAQMLFGEA